MAAGIHNSTFMLGSGSLLQVTTGCYNSLLSAKHKPDNLIDDYWQSTTFGVATETGHRMIIFFTFCIKSSTTNEDLLSSQFDLLATTVVA